MHFRSFISDGAEIREESWTAHITVFEVDCENSPRELHKASSRVCGGIKVDEEFYQFLNGVFGELVFSRFCKELQQDYLDFQRDIEFEKRRVGSKSTKLISFRLPCGLLDILQEETGKTLKEVVEESPYRNFLSIKREKLQIESEFLESMFTNCCESIVRNISNILETSAAEGLQLLVMAGGISNSELVKEAVANAFPNLIVMVPENAETAMMSGALWSAFNPISIPIRVLPYTYGIKILPLFDPSVHSEDRRVRINGKDRCKNVFRKYAGVNEEVEKDAITCHEHTTVFPFQKEMFLEIYGTNKPNPMYVDEFDVVRLGTLSVQLCQGRQECVVNVKFVFGGTEIKIEATDLSNNRKFTTSLNYLT
ncbi:heat shock 70 kDa protein 12B-like [Mercenaria mercenaria]|uniref:heat shock 70 kDa protein 12B-like n=1 Tax=Mercenaria mercenaria TaxID=6596 RepID=UPI00234F6EE3|nr:heat shock 70 kDa protein 12B-like [Mercenaria mercenaria]